MKQDDLFDRPPKPEPDPPPPAAETEEPAQEPTTPGLPERLAFDGKTFNQKFDYSRLGRQARAVFEVMMDEQWRTFSEIAVAISPVIPNAEKTSISARLRDYRKVAFGSHTMNSRRRGSGRRGLWEYQVIVNQAGVIPYKPKRKKYKKGDPVPTAPQTRQVQVTVTLPLPDGVELAPERLEEVRRRATSLITGEVLGIAEAPQEGRVSARLIHNLMREPFSKAEIKVFEETTAEIDVTISVSKADLDDGLETGGLDRMVNKKLFGEEDNYVLVDDQISVAGVEETERGNLRVLLRVKGQLALLHPPE